MYSNRDSKRNRVMPNQLPNKDIKTNGLCLYVASKCLEILSTYQVLRTEYCFKTTVLFYLACTVFFRMQIKGFILSYLANVDEEHYDKCSLYSLLTVLVSGGSTAMWQRTFFGRTMLKVLSNTTTSIMNKTKIDIYNKCREKRPKSLINTYIFQYCRK